MELQPQMPGRLCREGNWAANGLISKDALVHGHISVSNSIKCHQCQSVGQPHLDPPHQVTLNASFGHLHHRCISPDFVIALE